MASALEITVPEELAGERADRILAVEARIPRRVAKDLFDSGLVEIDGQPGVARDRLTEGSIIRSPAPRDALAMVPDPDVEFQVRLEDQFLAVVDKPPGVTVHPGAGKEQGTLAAGILARWPEVKGVGEEGRWGLVHRLDRDTSGLLLIAKQHQTLEALRAQLSRHEITRRYQALVKGSFDLPSGSIDAPIGRDLRRPTRQAVQSEGRPSRTHYWVTQDWSSSDVSLLDVELETGRTHQIRVHLASIGHPVCGDLTYGGPTKDLALPRVWLHAGELRFVHPESGHEVVVVAPLPEDLVGVLDALGPPT